MKIVGRAPVRLGLAGGGTDVASYADQFGGAVVNITISRFATASLEERFDGQVVVDATDIGQTSRFPAGDLPPDPDTCTLQLAVLRRASVSLGLDCPPLTLQTSVDVSPGTGLGSSSALVVAIVAALCRYQQRSLGEHEIAELAYEIERYELGSSCGRQDQYAAAYGGLNFMEFSQDHVDVTPLAISPSLRHELETHLMLFDTGRTRPSSDVIADQVARVAADRNGELEAMHELRRLAHHARGAIENGDLDGLGAILSSGMTHKLRSSSRIGGNHIAHLYRECVRLGATGGKVSGAGGGGFILLSCPVDVQPKITKMMRSQGCTRHVFDFVADGVSATTVK